jgi:hypothetical protein
VKPIAGASARSAANDYAKCFSFPRAERDELPCLSERGRGVLENTRPEKWRLDPLRVQRRNCRKLSDLYGRIDSRRMSNVIVTAGAYQCDRARVLSAVCIRMEALVQLRRSAERERPKKSGRKKRRHQSARRRTAFHWPRPSGFSLGSATIFCRIDTNRFVLRNGGFKFQAPNPKENPNSNSQKKPFVLH